MPTGSSDKPAINVGERVREMRKLRGLTLLKLAELVGTTPQTIQRLETNNMGMTMKWAEKIAAAFGCDSAVLFERQDQILVMHTRMNVMRNEAEILKVRAQQFISRIDEFLNVVEEACRAPTKP
jgi:transcriptional regulator with XRE-family HTH domain